MKIFWEVEAVYYGIVQVENGRFWLQGFLYRCTREPKKGEMTGTALLQTARVLHD